MCMLLPSKMSGTVSLEVILHLPFKGQSVRTAHNLLSFAPLFPCLKGGAQSFFAQGVRSAVPNLSGLDPSSIPGSVPGPTASGCVEGGREQASLNAAPQEKGPCSSPVEREWDIARPQPLPMRRERGMAWP